MSDDTAAEFSSGPSRVSEITKMIQALKDLGGWQGFNDVRASYNVNTGEMKIEAKRHSTPTERIWP